MSHFSLSMLEERLNRESYPTLHLEPTTLIVYLGGEEKERALEIVLKEQASFPGEEEKARQYILQFRYQFPFGPNDVTLVDTARLVAFINHSFEVPGVELDEVNQTLQYRYVAFGSMDKPDLDTMCSIVGVVVLFVDLFQEALFQVASGKVTTNNLLEKSLFAIN